MSFERRRHRRTRAYRPVRLHPTKARRALETLTKDLSSGGVRCISGTVFPVSTELNLELVLSTGHEPLSFRGRVAWFRMIPHSEQVDLGITFLDASPINIRRLSAYLERLPGDPAPVHA